MKRTLSILLALMLAAGMSLNSFAVTALNENTETNVPLSTEAAASSLSLGFDEESGLSFGSHLEPNQTYRFPILLDRAPVKEEQLEGLKLRVETAEDRNAVRSIKVIEDNGEYLLEVKTLSGYPTEAVHYVGQLKLMKKNSSKAEAALELSFSSGYNSVNAESVQAAQQGEELLLENSAPVISEEQFDYMDRELNGDKLIIRGDGWTYEVRITGQKDVNMVHNDSINRDIVRQFNEQNFAFLSFPAGPVFDFTGTLTIDLSDYEDLGERVYLYSYYNNKLNRVFATYVEYEETLSFPTKYFGHFVITDKEIPNGTVIHCEDEKPVTPSEPVTGKPNPETGAF